jgi:hypothetical protein
MSARFGTNGITDAVRRQYIAHMTNLILGGMLSGKADMLDDIGESPAVRA